MLRYFTTHKSRSRGFTLIELLVVTGISALLLLTVTSMFATFLMSNVRTNLRRQVQTEGNGALERIEFLIRNATSASCLTSPTRLVIDYDDEEYTIKLAGTQLEIDSEDIPSEKLTSNAVQVSDLTCLSTTSPPTVITLSYIVKTAADAENTLQQTFSTRTLVRNTAF